MSEFWENKKAKAELLIGKNLIHRAAHLTTKIRKRNNKVRSWKNGVNNMNHEVKFFRAERMFGQMYYTHDADAD